MMFRLNVILSVTLFSAVSGFFAISSGHAETFALPTAEDSVLGELRYAPARENDTLIDIAREYDLGYDQIVRANPDANRWVPGAGTKVVLPHLYVLPPAARKGILLNIAEMRLYYFPPAPKGAEQDTVVTFPVSIGRMDWKTPLGGTKVISKERDPPWRPPKSIREEHAREGEILPEVVPGGTPDNPLGRFALRLGFPGYLIHGVDERKSYGIGMRVTHGCVRMYPEDIEALFQMVPVKTPVEIMNEPIKVGWRNDELFLEVHQPFDEGENEEAPTLSRLPTENVVRFVRERLTTDIAFDEDKVAQIAEAGDGIPGVIARRAIRPAESLEATPDEAPADEKPSPSTLDSEYEKAISQYVNPPPAQREAPRREDRRIGSEDSEVRRYLEEQY